MSVRKTKNAWFIIFLGAVSYFSCYITRVNLRVVIEALAERGIFDKNTIVLATTFNTVAYGAGLITAGVLTTKLKPKTMLIFSLFSTALMNIAMPFSGHFGGNAAVVAAWCVNGFVQAFLWPSVIQIFLTELDDKDYESAVLFGSTGGSVAHILLYLVSPFILGIGTDGWRLVFLIPALFPVLCAFIWIFCPFGNTLPEVKTAEKTNERVFTPMIWAAALAIVIAGILYDGVGVWMPTYINENYHLGANISILSGVALPVFNVLATWLVLSVVRKLKNPVFLTAFVFVAASLFALILAFSSRFSFGAGVFAAVFSMAGIEGAMTGVNMLLINILPRFYASTGKGAMLNGILNAFAYVGNAVSIYGVVLFSNSFGWNATVFLWAGIALLGCGVCVLILPAWNRKFGGAKQ